MRVAEWNKDYPFCVLIIDDGEARMSSSHDRQLLPKCRRNPRIARRTKKRVRTMPIVVTGIWRVRKISGPCVRAAVQENNGNNEHYQISCQTEIETIKMRKSDHNEFQVWIGGVHVAQQPNSPSVGTPSPHFQHQIFA